MGENTSGTGSAEQGPNGGPAAPQTSLAVVGPSTTSGGRAAGAGVTAVLASLFVIGLAAGYFARPDWSQPSTVKDYFVSIAHSSRPFIATSVPVDGGALGVKSASTTTDGPFISIECASYAMTYNARTDSLYDGLSTGKGQRWDVVRQGLENKGTRAGSALLGYIGVGSVLKLAQRLGPDAWEYTTDLARGGKKAQLTFLAAVAVMPLAAGLVLSYNGRPDCESEGVKSIFMTKPFYQKLAKSLRADGQAGLPTH